MNAKGMKRMRKMSEERISNPFPRILYLSRTHSQLGQVIESIEKLDF